MLLLYFTFLIIFFIKSIFIMKYFFVIITLDIEKKTIESFIIFEFWTKNNFYPFLTLKKTLIELNY